MLNPELEKRVIKALFLSLCGACNQIRGTDQGAESVRGTDQGAGLGQELVE